jgi:hypothetical protein
MTVYQQSSLAPRIGGGGGAVGEARAVPPNKAMEPTGLSLPARPDRPRAGGSSPSR